MTGRVHLGRIAASALILALLVPAGAAEAQPARKNQRVAVLSNELSPALDGLRHGLRDLGYVEGRDVLIVNMRTARAIGLTVPPSLLVRADSVIE